MRIEAKTDLAKTLLESIDESKPIAQQLGYDFLELLQECVERLKREYKIEKTKTSFRYSKEWTNDAKKYQEARDILGHVPATHLPKDTEEMNKSIKEVFANNIEQTVLVPKEDDKEQSHSIKGSFENLDNILEVTFKFVAPN